jgi:hypothetical protein
VKGEWEMVGEGGAEGDSAGGESQGKKIIYKRIYTHMLERNGRMEWKRYERRGWRKRD